MAVDVFAVPIFFICFRECLESVIIVSVLLAWLKSTLGPDRDRTVYKRLVKQVWAGVILGLIICLAVGGTMIAVFYTLGKDAFSGTEDIWEGSFSLVATIIISMVGAALLRVSKLQDKWRVKLARALEKQELKAQRTARGRFQVWCQKYAMFLLPFVTVLREGLEAVIFIGGVGETMPATSFPLAVVCGLAAGVLVGYLIYRGGLTAKLQVFLIISTCFLYLVAAGLFSKAVWAFEEHWWNKKTGGDAASIGSGPGSYDIHNTVWHVNCCNAEVNGGGFWGIFNAILGWENSATYGSVISYNVYWIAVIIVFLSMRYNEKKGHWPFMKAKAPAQAQNVERGVAETNVESGPSGGVFLTTLDKKPDAQVSVVREGSISE